MKVVIYSSLSAEGFLSFVSSYTSKPSLSDQWQGIRKRYPEVTFGIVASEGGAAQLFDFDENKKEIIPEGIDTVLLPMEADADEFVAAIVGEAPDLVIAATYFGGPMDWDALKDAIIADDLEKKGIRTIAHSMFAATTFFDKWNTHQVMMEKGFPVAKAVHIPSIYLTMAKDHPDIRSNVYLELILHQIRQMSFPLIIKASAGSGSQGISIVEDYDTAKRDILSRSEPVDVIVEEMIPGEQFGVEIHGDPGNYTILPPFKCAVNEQGITDPLHYMKIGPITDEKYRIEELRSMLRRLATEMGLAVSANADLAFSDGKWYIIEVNPRISGMSVTAAACEGRTPLEVIIESGLERRINYNYPSILEKCLNFRTMAPSEELAGFGEESVVVYMEISKVPSEYNPGNVDISMANIVLSGFADFSEMADKVRALHEKYPHVVTDKMIALVEQNL
ncbi:MAG: ATP-grasp domain-containing protein [Eubacterium sp.]|nr:ATP-grasp domain-containing protein [Eubacterium sp.]